MRGMGVSGGFCECFNVSGLFFLGIGIWGCAKVYGRGTLYMKWGQQNQRFGTMRLRGEKDENRVNSKKEKRDNMIK